MSVEATTDQQQEMSGTKPVREHEWLKKMVGKWNVESEMKMGPDGPTESSTGTETFEMFGDLWVLGEGESGMPGGGTMRYRVGLGYDVSFKEYRGFWLGDVSSHLWKQVGTLSPDERIMTLDCEGPHMEKEGETANYRDVIEFIDDNHRTLTSYGQDDSGEWQQFMKARATRV